LKKRLLRRNGSSAGAAMAMGMFGEFGVVGQTTRVTTLGRPMPFPPTRKAVLSYTQSISIATSATANTYGTAFGVNVNSLFLPTSTGGHQPLYFDQFAALYARYKVERTRVQIVAIPIDSTSIYELSTLLLRPSDSGTLGGSTVDVVMEKEWMQSVKLSNQGNLGPGKLHWDIDMAKACAVTKKQFAADVEDYAALTSASPARKPLLEIAATNVSANAAINVRVTVCVFFTVEFFDLITVAQS